MWEHEVRFVCVGYTDTWGLVHGPSNIVSRTTTVGRRHSSTFRDPDLPVPVERLTFLAQCHLVESPPLLLQVSDSNLGRWDSSLPFVVEDRPRLPGWSSTLSQVHFPRLDPPHVWT